MSGRTLTEAQEKRLRDAGERVGAEPEKVDGLVSFLGGLTREELDDTIRLAAGIGAESGGARG